MTAPRRENMTHSSLDISLKQLLTVVLKACHSVVHNGNPQGRWTPELRLPKPQMLALGFETENTKQNKTTRHDQRHDYNSHVSLNISTFAVGDPEVF